VRERTEEAAALGCRPGDFSGEDTEVCTWRQMEAGQLRSIDYARAISTDNEVKGLGVLLG
jgi:hypothetical protein